MYKCKSCDFQTENKYQLGSHCQKIHTKLTVKQKGKFKRFLFSKECLKCKKIFTVERKEKFDGTISVSKKEKKFCCLQCANSRNTNKEVITRISCKNCKQSFKKKKGKFFCSKKCYNENKYKTKLELVTKENNFFILTSKSSTVRNFLIKHYGHKCSICNIENWMGEKVPVVMDHIDGNSDNWQFTNLRIICRNCDGLLPTFAGRNVGKNKIQSKRMKEQNERIKSGKQKTREVKQ